MNRLSLAGLLILFLQAASQIRAEVPLEGYLIAERDCPATTSIKKQQNPGNVKLVLRQAYPVIAKNQEDATHFLIQIDPDRPLSELLSAASRVSNSCSGGVIDAAGFGR